MDDEQGFFERFNGIFSLEKKVNFEKNFMVWVLLCYPSVVLELDE